VLPIRASNVGNTDSYSGSEYLSLYPYISIDNNFQGENTLWVHENQKKFIDYDSWVKYNKKPVQHLFQR
jgi:hypothetical protein